MDNIDDKIKEIALKLRAIRELKGLTREEFCKPLKENVEYWGAIERGKQTISLAKLIQVCEEYDIHIENVVDLDYEVEDDDALRSEIDELLNRCKGRQLEIVKKFVQEIALIL